MGEDGTRKSPLAFIDSKTVMLSLDEDFCDFLEERPQTSENSVRDLADRDQDAERKLADISMALHQLMGLKAN